MPVIKNQFTMRLDPEIHYKIKKIAETENRSMTNMIEYLICKEIKRYEHVFKYESDHYIWISTEGI